VAEAVGERCMSSLLARRTARLAATSAGSQKAETYEPTSDLRFALLQKVRGTLLQHVATLGFIMPSNTCDDAEDLTTLS
jgi:hypothetical protein